MAGERASATVKGHRRATPRAASIASRRRPNVQARLDRPDYAPVAESLREVGFESAAGIFRTYAGRQSDLGRWFGNGEITHDSNLRLMYTAGWGINSVRADSIYSEMLRYRVVPDDLFQGSPEAVQQLLARIASGR